AHPYVGALPDTELARSLNAQHLRGQHDNPQQTSVARQAPSMPQAPQQQSHAAQQQPVQHQQVQQAQQEPAQASNQQITQPATQAEEFYSQEEPEDIPFDPNDYEAYVADLEAMEQMNAGFEPIHDPQLDDLL